MYIIVSYGIFNFYFSGCGLCCIETPQVVVLPQYFKEKKELATSFRVAGNPIGAVVLPFILVSLFEEFGVKLSFIFISGIFFQLFVLVTLIRPHETHVQIIRNDFQRRRKSVHFSTGNSTKFLPSDHKNSSITKRVNWKLLGNPLFMTHIAMMFLFSSSMPHCLYFLLVYGRTIGLSPAQNSTVLTFQALCDAFLRISFGACLNRKMFKNTHAFTVTFVLIEFVYFLYLGCLYIVEIITFCRRLNDSQLNEYK